jgi:hypothetical protein
MRGRQLLERRSKFLRQIGQGVPLNETVNSLSVEYEVSQRALYQDWQHRSKWANQIVGLDDPDSFVMELIDFLKWLRQRSVLEVLQGDSSANRIGAIRTAISVIQQLFTIAEATGKVQKVPAELHQDITLRWLNGANPDG